jgi:hypothetical protein
MLDLVQHELELAGFSVCAERCSRPPALDEEWRGNAQPSSTMRQDIFSINVTCAMSDGLCAFKYVGEEVQDWVKLWRKADGRSRTNLAGFGAMNRGFDTAWGRSYPDLRLLSG